MNTDLSFVKMHGLGNDFVIIDARRTPVSLSPQRIRFLADRRRGVGCDQLIVMEPPSSPDSAVFMRIFNADGSQVAACGNASRCVGWLCMEESGAAQVVIETKAGRLNATRAGENSVCVDMGPARLDWRELPLAQACDTLHLPLAEGPLSDPVGVSMGNPHAVFFVDDAAAVDLATWGPRLENHPLFPERTNVEVVQILSPGVLRMRVWERGAGITEACGTGACASLVAAVRRGLAPRTADVILDGGTLSITWNESDAKNGQEGHVLMTGPVALSFQGHVTQDAMP